MFGVAHGMYAAGFLGAITRGAAKYGLQFSNSFEPVNEGAFNVFAHNITVTPVGQVRQLRHRFRTLFSRAFARFFALFRGFAPHGANALPGAHAERVLIAAWHPMLWPIWGFR